MATAADVNATLDEGIRQNAIPFSPDSPETLNRAVDKMMAAVDANVELLGLAEPMHGAEEFLVLRNRVFQRLVEAHGYSAIAVESSFPRSREIDEYVAGRGTTKFDAIREQGFSHWCGRLAANRELVEWMRAYNVGRSDREELSFYGFDSPTEMTHSDSPRQLLMVAIDFLSAMDDSAGRERQRRVEQLLGDDAAWENSEANMDPTKSIGLSPAATALRIETEDLITELCTRRPELTARSDAFRFHEALHHAEGALRMLSYHAAVARQSDKRLADLLGQRDLMMAENLVYIVERERGRGKVLAFAHNSHLQYGSARWKLGPQLLEWWPAGSQLRELLGTRYQVIGAAVGESADNGIGQPEANTLEAALTSTGDTARFVPTAAVRTLCQQRLAELPLRTGSVTNSSYFPLSGRSFTDFDWLVALNSAAVNRVDLLPGS